MSTARRIGLSFAGRLALVGVAGGISMLAAASDDPSVPSPRVATLEDARHWKRIVEPRLSPDGAWLAYRYGAEFAPGEVVVRSTRDQTEHRFAAGEPPRTPAGAARPVLPEPGFSFAHDSRFLAYLIYPESQAPRRLSGRDRGEAADAEAERNKLGLVELATGESIEIQEVESYAFAGDRADWIAVRKRGPARKDASGAAPGRGGAARRERERPGPGADLLLRHLDSGRTFTIGHVTEYAFDESGRFLAWAVHPEDETGAGVQLRDLESGVVRLLASGGEGYSGLRWLEHGDALAFLEGEEDETWEQDRFRLWGFSGFASGEPIEVSWDPAGDPGVPADMSLHPGFRPYWLEDRSAIAIGLRRLLPRLDAEEAGQEGTGAADGSGGAGAVEEGDGDEGESRGTAEGESRSESENDHGPEPADLVIWHWRDRRLPSQQRVEEERDRGRSRLALLRLPDRKLIRLADDVLEQVTLGEDDRFAIGVDRDRYLLDGTLDGRFYQDVWALDPRTGERWLAAEKVRWYYGADPTGTRVLLYRDRDFWCYDLAERRLRNLTAGLRATFVDLEDDHNVVDPPVQPPGWSEDGAWALLADNWNLWKVPADGDASRAVNLTRDGEERGIRYRRALRLDPEDEGLDLAEPLYVTAYGERTKRGGVARLVPGADHTELLLWEDAYLGGLIAAEEAPVYAYTRETWADYPDVWVAGPDLADGRRLTEAGAQREGIAWSQGRRLLDYESTKGDRLQATLHLPAGYEPNRRYPTVVYIYERMTPFHHRFYPPEATGFNVALYTSAGYAVLMPDIRYHVDDPGRSAVWSVLPALDAAVASGVVDPQRVGLHGHSWGGYQTAFLVTQTDRFRAAVAGAPLTDLVSMYSSIYWNTGSANQPLFESRQGRFSGDYLTVLDAYVRNSPVFNAKKVDTPLLILHNDKDGAVDWNQGIEYFNILRRLRKPVVMLQYEGENHGLAAPANRLDYSVRMREFFDHYLRGEAAPRWLTEGMPRLELERHLEERARAGAAPGPPA